MKETIKIELNSNDLKELLLDYYKRYFNDEKIKLEYTYKNTQTKVDNIPDYKLDDYVKIDVLSSPKVGTFNALKTISIDGIDISKMLEIELAKSGYNVDFLSFKIVEKNLSVVFGTNKKYNVSKLEKNKVKRRK